MLRTELTLTEVGLLLDEIDASTGRFAASLAKVGQRGLAAPAARRSWTRATIAAHLTWVAERYVSMTADALAGVKTTTYPAGASERDASLRLFDHATPQQALARLQHASAALVGTWRHLEDQQWSTAMSEEADEALPAGRPPADRVRSPPPSPSAGLPGHPLPCPAHPHLPPPPTPPPCRPPPS